MSNRSGCALPADSFTTSMRAASLFGDPDHTRTLRRLCVKEGATTCFPQGRLSVGVVVDVETTGKIVDQAVIIELALRRFQYDEAGAIVRIGRPFSWREDPCCALEPQITRLTGLTDADLVGKRIDDAQACRLLKSADLVIAHNAEFDRKFIERRLPDAAGLPWACTCMEIDWAEWGFEGRALGFLCMQMGLFFEAHRAGTDVDALLALLSEELADGRPVLGHICESAVAPTHRIEAIGAAYACKDLLKARGYRWNERKRAWWTEVRDCDLIEEQAWLAAHVYSHPGTNAFGPTIQERTARERYS